MTQKKTQEELEKELREAEKLIKVGGVYSHYKNPQNLYTVIALAIQEATNKICVIYQAEYGKKLIFVRDLDIWLSKPETHGEKVERFTRIKAA
jgi:hypothetical protein